MSCWMTWPFLRGYHSHSAPGANCVPQQKAPRAISGTSTAIRQLTYCEVKWIALAANQATVYVNTAHPACFNTFTRESEGSLLERGYLGQSRPEVVSNT